MLNRIFFRKDLPTENAHKQLFSRRHSQQRSAAHCPEVVVNRVATTFTHCTAPTTSG